MNAFIIQDLVADCTHGYQVFLNLPEGRTNSRAIISNLSLYSPIDEDFPQNKIMNLIDGERREGWLNFYFMRFSNNSCHIFSFGLNNETEISVNSYIGEFQAFPDVLNQLTGRLNKAVEESADEFRCLYNTRNTTGIKNLVAKIIHSIR